MKLTTALLLLTLLAPALVVPTAAAKPWCYGWERDCPGGNILCTYREPQVCVPDPCWTTQCWLVVEPAEPDVLDVRNCFTIYREYHVGDVSIVMRSSCDVQVYHQGEPVLR